MKKLRNTYSVVLVGSLIISQMSGYTASAASGVSGYPSPAIAAVTASPISNLGSIQLGSKFQATLEDVNIWPQAGGNILTYTLNYTNGSNSNANLLHYFSRVITPAGSVIPGNPITGDVLKKKVVPKGNLRVTYYVNIGTTNSLKGLKIPMYVWDAKVKGYLRQVGTFKLPANYSPTVAIGKSLNTTMNDIPVTAYTESLQLYEYSGKVYAKVGVSLTNKGDKVLGDPGYKVYLVSAGGTSFELALDSSQVDYKIQPQEKKVVYYMTEIPGYLNTNNMKLQFVQKDETLKLDLPKSSYNLPVATTPDLIVEKDVVKKIMINNNMIETQLNNATVFKEDNKGMWSFQLRLKNTGNKAVKMPSYELAVKSPKGKSFPVNAKDLNGIIINPLEEKIIQFTAQVPLEVEQDKLQLQMIETVSADTISPTAESAGVKTKLNLPVAYYNIPYILRTNTLTGFEYNATNSYGSFAYNLLSLQRFPWMEDDIVVAKLRITNTQLVTLSLPELKGALKVDYDDLMSSTELFMDKQSVVLAPGKSVDINVLAKVPYTTDFNNMQVSLYSTVDKESIPFLTLSTNSTMDAVNTIQRGGNFRITDKGKNATIQEKKTVVYQGISSNIVSTELLISNEESRQSKMVRLQAYYKTANGEFYEATSNQPEAAVSPGGKQLITFWSKLPKSVKTSDLSLYMGSGITGNKLSEPGQEATGFINIASLALNSYTPSTNLAEVTLYPYTLSIQSSNGRLKEGSESISIDVNYNLFRDGSYDTGTFNHKLMLKMTDPYGQSQEKALALGTDLTEGNNNTFTLSFSNDRYKSLNGGTYRLTLYDEFQGERIELASQEYSLTYEQLPEMEQ
ncbi:hypothetical protein ACP8HI_09260 [Paenibacillus sp. FA6]|uniref:hypothetical protein n=1 Tax=Paenibacillus sp. FA6 TaxID=3413029 RepID=UPI003F65B76B